MNVQKIGSRFEKDFKSSVSDYILRLRSMQGFKGTDNPGDFLVYNGKYILFIECKTIKEGRFNLSNLRAMQLWKLVEACSNPNVFGGYLIYIRKTQECFFIETGKFLFWYLTRDRQSIPYSWMKENGLLVPMQLKRTRYRYDIDTIYKWVEENCYVAQT